ncbi:MAG: IS66-like element accessory protein TnpA [Methylocystis sp.]
MSISERKHMPEPEAFPARRIEVFTGSGRRRTWGVDQKAAIVAESFAPGASVCEVARRHGLTPQQLFTWRRQARKDTQAREDTVAPVLFVPAIMQEPAPAPLGKRERRAVRQEVDSTPTIELEVDGVTVRVGRGAQAKTIAAVIRALKAAK